MCLVCRKQALPYSHIADMVSSMKTTFNIDDALMHQLRIEAARRGVTMTHIVESGIRHIIANGEEKQSAKYEMKPLPTWDSGGMLVDVADREELFRIFDEDESWS